MLRRTFLQTLIGSILPIKKKTPCRRCKGSGKIHSHYYNWGKRKDVKATCPDCGGSGNDDDYNYCVY